MFLIELSPTDATNRAIGAAVMRKMMHIAARPDGERAKANIQPPIVPKRKNIGVIGGFSIF